MSAADRTDELPWWKLPVSTRIFLAGLALLSFGCCLRPMLLDAIALGLVRLADFRFWPWWFFLELAIALAFSIRWFLLLSARNRDMWPELRQQEANAFFRLTGSICVTMLCAAVLDRFGLPRLSCDCQRVSSGPIAVSWTVLFAVIGGAVLLFHAFLARNWTLYLRKR